MPLATELLHLPDKPAGVVPERPTTGFLHARTQQPTCHSPVVTVLFTSGRRRGDARRAHLAEGLIGVFQREPSNLATRSANGFSRARPGTGRRTAGLWGCNCGRRARSNVGGRFFSTDTDAGRGGKTAPTSTYTPTFRSRGRADSNAAGTTDSSGATSTPYPPMARTTAAAAFPGATGAVAGTLRPAPGEPGAARSGSPPPRRPCATSPSG